MRRRFLSRIEFSTSVCLLALPSVLLAQAPAKGGAEPPVVYRLDSAEIQSPNISRDNKWVAFVQWINGSSSIWMGALPNGKPIRITSDGYYDFWPVISPAGDRIFFVSTRPGRGSSASSYLMSVPIDPGTAQPTGTPRQVVAEEVNASTRVVRSISWDGKWLAYNSDPRTLKVVPTEGGNPRTLATGEYITPALFARDNVHIYFEENRANGSGVLKKVSVNGGPATTVVDGKNAHVYAYPPDPDKGYLRITTVPPKDALFELFDYQGKKAAQQLHAPMMQGTMRGDGLGLAGASTVAWSQIERVSLVTGLTTNISSVSPTHLVGLEANGSIAAFWTELNKPTTLMMLSDADAKTQSSFELPREIDRVAAVLTGRRLLLSSGPGASPLLRSLYVVDPRTRESHKVTDSAYHGWNSNSDLVAGYGELAGNSVRIKSFDSTGHSFLAWTFQKDVFDSLGDKAMRGGRVAYALKNKRRDSMMVYVTDGVGKPPRLLGGYPATAKGPTWTDLEWSPTGAFVCAVFQTPDRSEYRITVFDARETVSKPLRASSLETGLQDWDQIQWLPDETGFVVLGTTKDEKGDKIILRPIDGTRQPATIVKNDEGRIEMFDTALDGKSLLYALNVPRGASVWSVDYFSPPVKW